MFKLVTNELGSSLLDLGIDIICQRQINRSYNFSSNKRNRTLSLGGIVDLKNQIVDIDIHYKSDPKLVSLRK